MTLRSFTPAVALIALVGMAACSSDEPEELTGLDFTPSFDVVPLPGFEIHVTVCKVGLDAGTVGQPFTFATTATGGGVLAPSLTLAAQSDPNPGPDCRSVWHRMDVSYDTDSRVSITELDAPGFNLASASYFQAGEAAPVPLTVTNGSVEVTPGKGGWVVFYNEEDQPEAPGRMTGGGHQIRVDGVRVTRGLTLHCDVDLSNNLEINWAGGNNWHLEKESLTEVSCIDDPAYDETPPRAPFNTFIARATGSLNGVDGSIIDFKFIDDGEPGRTDEAYMTVYEVGMGPGQVAAGSEVVAMEVGGVLDGGNLQAHYDQPHK